MTRIGSFMSWDKSNNSIKFCHFLLGLRLRSILISPIIISSRPVVCAVRAKMRIVSQFVLINVFIALIGTHALTISI